MSAKLRGRNAKIGYKVLKKFPNGELHSCTMGGFSAGRTYPLKGWTIPALGCGPLTCFHKLKHAIKFRARNYNSYSYSRIKIYKCMYIPSHEEMVHNGKYDYRLLRILPTGTRLAKEIMLLEGINNIESSKIP